MATATLKTGTTPTVIDNAEAVTNWGGDTFALNTGQFVQGNSSVECAQTNNGNNDVYVSGSWDFTTDVHLRLWFNITYIGNLSATNPIQVSLYDGTNTSYWYWDAYADYSGGWAQIIVYTGDTPDVDNTVTMSAITQIGLRFVTASKPRNVPYNALFDAWTYGDGYTVTGGTSGDELTWDEIATADAVGAYGVVKKVGGVYFLAGDIQIGDGVSTTYFKPQGQIAVFQNEQVLSTLYNISFVDTASNLTNIEVLGGAWAIDGTLRYTIDASDTNLNTFDMSGLQMSGAGIVSFAASGGSYIIDNTVFDNCLQVDPSTSTFESNTFSNSVDTGGALLYPNTETYIQDLVFINCDNGVEMDTTTTNSGAKTSFSFDNFIFDDEAGNFDVNNTSGVTLSVSKTNGSNPNSYTGTLVNFVGASVTTEIYVKDLATGGNISGARVLVEVINGVNFPYQASVTITGTGTTATVAHTAHGLASGDNVIIRGVNEDVYNGAYTIIVTGVNAYTYTTNETIGTSPATGTITSTFAFLNGDTNASGYISDTRVVNNDQLISGWVRKSSASPYYRQGVVSGTVSSATGFSTIIQLANDE